MAEIITLRSQAHEVMECIFCGVVYTVSVVVLTFQRQEGGFHHCPNGHVQGWTKGGSLFEKQRLALDRANQQIARAEDETREAVAAKDRAESAQRRLKKRVGNGICPCCNRTFQALARHMKSKHPDYDKGK